MPIARSGGIPEIYAQLQGILCVEHLRAPVCSAWLRGQTTKHLIYGTHIPEPLLTSRSRAQTVGRKTERSELSLSVMDPAMQAPQQSPPSQPWAGEALNTQTLRTSLPGRESGQSTGAPSAQPAPGSSLDVDPGYFTPAASECSRLMSRLSSSMGDIWTRLPKRNELVSFWISPSGAPSVPAPSPTTRCCSVTRGSPEPRKQQQHLWLSTNLNTSMLEYAQTHTSSTFIWAGKESLADRFSLAALSTKKKKEKRDCWRLG